MGTSRPFAYNSGATITGTTQFVNVAIGAADLAYTGDPGGIKWWMGPDESSGYVIGVPVPAGNQPTPLGNIGTMRFWKSESLSGSSFVQLTNSVRQSMGLSTFTGVTDAQAWLTLSGYPTNFGYEYETQVVCARMDTQPSEGLKALINAVIVNLKSAGVWDRADVIYKFNLHTQQASNLNWKGNEAYNITALNSPTWTQYTGYTGAAGTAIDTNYIPANHGIRHIRNYNMFAVNQTNETINDSGTLCGAYDGTVNTYIRPRRTSNESGYWYNNTTTQYIQQSVTGTTFMQATWRNGASLGWSLYNTLSSAGSRPSNGNMTKSYYMLAYNNNGSIGLPLSGARISDSYIGSILDQTQFNGLISAMTFFNDNVALEYEPELITYINGLSTPLSTNQKTYLNTFIHDLKTGLTINNLYEAFAVILIFANETSEAALRNVVMRSYDATAINSPTFGQYSGFTGNGTSSYVRCPFNPLRHSGLPYIRDNASIGTYIRVIGTQGVYCPFGSYLTGANPLYYNAFFMPNRGSGSRYGVINSLTTSVAYDNTNAGLHTLVRNSSSSNKWYAPDQTYSYSISTVGLANNDTAFLAMASEPAGAIYFYNGQLSLGFIGRGFSNDEITIIKTAFNNYMTSLGTAI